MVSKPAPNLGNYKIKEVIPAIHRPREKYKPLKTADRKNAKPHSQKRSRIIIWVDPPSERNQS
jgi:hypothetical protein